MLLASDMLCIKEDIYTEVNEFAGLPTLESGFRFFDNGKKQMLIIYNEEAIYPIVDALEDKNVEKPIITYVFSPANDPWNTEFESVSDKVRLTALPAAIYNAYRRVLPKPKDILIREEEAKEFEAEKESLGGLFDNNEEGGEA
jgi:adenine-specific DNA-methyltransferase